MTYEFFAPTRKAGAIGIFEGHRERVEAETPGEATELLLQQLERQGLELGRVCGTSGRDYSFRVVSTE